MFDQAKLKYNYFKIFKNIIFTYYQKYFVVYILVYMCALYVCNRKAHLPVHTYTETKGGQQLSSIVMHLMI